MTEASYRRWGGVFSHASPWPRYIHHPVRATIFSVRHFQIAWALLRFYARVMPKDWYRRPPFLPLPPADYFRWRLRTAYGEHRPPIGTVLRDVWQFGDWLRTFPG